MLFLENFKMPAIPIYNVVDRFIPRRTNINKECVINNKSDFESSVEMLYQYGFADTEPVFTNTAKYINNLITYRKCISCAMNIKTDRILECSISSKSSWKGDGNKEPAWPMISRKNPLIGPPENILDMPDIDLFRYNHPFDWSKQGQISTVFHDQVYIWNSECNNSVLLDQITSALPCIKWSKDGTKLAVSHKWAKISIIDGGSLKIITSRKCPRHQTCIFSAIEWTSNDTIIAGCRDGVLAVFYLKHSRFSISFEPFSDQFEIGTIKLSCNENILLVSCNNGRELLLKWPFDNHIGPYRMSQSRNIDGYAQGVAWHPWKEPLLARSDIKNIVTLCDVNNKHIKRFTAKPFCENFDSIVDCISFNPLSAELLVAFYCEDPDTQADTGMSVLTIFNNIFKRTDEVTFHKGRVFHVMWDQTGTKLATVGADETLVIWNFFGKDSPTEKKLLGKIHTKSPRSILEATIR